jgi:hypothetical protein
MSPLSDPTTETFAISLPENGNGNDVAAGLSPKKNRGFLGVGITEAKTVACVVASESSVEISFDNNGRQQSVHQSTPLLSTAVVNLTTIPEETEIPAPKAKTIEKKQTKPPKLSKKDKKQLIKGEKAAAQSSQSQALLVKNNINNNIKIYKNKKVHIKKIIMGLKKKKERKETEEERDQALAAISTSRSWDVDEEQQTSSFKQAENENDLQVITEEELNRAWAASIDLLKPLQTTEAAMATLTLSPQQRVDGLQTFHTNATTTNNNDSNNNSESDESEDDDDDDMKEGNSVREERERDDDFRSSRRGRGDESGVLADAVEGFLTLIGLGDPVDDATTIGESKKESKKSRSVTVTRGRRSNNRKKSQINAKGKEGKVNTTEECDGYMSGIKVYFLSGLSCSGAGTEPAIRETASRSSNKNKSKKMGNVTLLLNELEESPKNHKTSDGVSHMNNDISFADSVSKREGVEV